MTRFSDQVRIRLISQLIKSILRALQNLLNYFNGTVIFSSIIPALLILSKNLDLSLSDSESVVLLFGSPLQNCQNSYVSFGKYICITIIT